jgi:hypothetical protein
MMPTELAGTGAMLSKTVVGVVVGAVFGVLAALHVSWACGVAWGAGVAVPEIDGRPKFVPSRAATLAVAAALAAATIVVLARADLVLRSVPSWISQSAAVVLGTVFMLRAIGDFGVMGFFKSVRRTSFAVWDTWLYSPLCLLLGVATLWLAFGAEP